MAKVPFSKFQASMNTEIHELKYFNKSGEEIKYEVKSYLPFKDKLDLVSKIINQSIDDNGFYNPMRVKMYMSLEIVYAYTNLSFTEKIKEDPFKLYDILVSTGIFSDVAMTIDKEDLQEIQEDVFATIKNIYDYKNSVMGILDTISTDYSNLDLNASEIQKKLADPDNMDLLRSILTKLG